MTIFEALCVAIIITVCVSLALAGMMLIIDATMGGELMPIRPLWQGLIGAAAIVPLITVVVYGVANFVDNSEHCGPGTVYRESRHYNPATKTTQTDWWCEAK